MVFQGLVDLFLSFLLFHDRFNRDSISATCSGIQFEHGFCCNRLFRDGVGLRVGLVVGIGGIGVDCSFIFHAFVEEVELHGR